MDELQEALHKLHREQEHLRRIFEDNDLHVELALSQAKRVRSACTFLVRALAVERDNRYSPGGHK